MLDTSTFKQSRETKIIANLFKSLPERDDPLVTHRELCEATNKKLNDIRGAIATAQKYVLNNDGLVVENDRSIGYRLAKGAEITKVAERGSEKARNQVRKARKKINTIDTTTLTLEERVGVYVLKSVLELQGLPARPRTRSNVKQMVLRKHNELDEQELLEAIKEGLLRKR